MAALGAGVRYSWLWPRLGPSRYRAPRLGLLVSPLETEMNEPRQHQPLDRKPWINGHSMLDQWTCVGFLMQLGRGSTPLPKVLFWASESARIANAAIARMILNASEDKPK